jgi:hydrogenase maturation protein HypF
VGFRPFVYRLAHSHALAGWVLNGERGVEIFLEGAEQDLQAFLRDLNSQPPPAASIAEIEVTCSQPEGFRDFTIRESEKRDRPTVRVSPDLSICADCLAELFDPSNPRYRYPYINCTNCGPRYTVILALPYDRPNTTMKDWPLDAYCSAEYHDPANRRFHAQPVACPNCGPKYRLQEHDGKTEAAATVERAAALLNRGEIVAVKGLGGYHLACDARNSDTVLALRERKYRKEKPFAVMTRDLETARSIVELSAEAEGLMTGIARPILLAPAKIEVPGVAPDNNELGVMLPYTPVHHLLFAAGAPPVLVMTSANRSSEPIAYQDNDALTSLAGIADVFLIGERPIARRVDDSVVRAGAYGPMILRRARGYAPGAVATLPVETPLLAVGADLKNTVTLVVKGQAFVSHHIGDLDHYAAFSAFQQSIRDLMSMYEVRWEDVLIAHDAHPQYVSTSHARKLPAASSVSVQHHRAHIASVLAERGEWDRRVVGVSFDGTGYGDDGSIWGGEIFVGSVRRGFERVAHLRQASLPGGDAAARSPVQAAAGFLCQVEGLPDLAAPPFNFPPRYFTARELVHKGVRSFGTTSMGRLFDTVAALLGFTREITFEGQAAMWVEQLARRGKSAEVYRFPLADGILDFCPLLEAVVRDRSRGRTPADVARSFHLGLAGGVCDCVERICANSSIDTVVLSGGVFQNELLLENVRALLNAQPVEVWTNHAVPPNDGGISLGQAALAAFVREGS